MSLIRRLSFNLWYLRRPPWDSGLVPPEVVDYIAAHRPGRALDLGCGTGTSSLALARAGWQVTGVDFAPRAVRIAKRKMKTVNTSAEFLVTDVTRLPHSLFTIPYDLVLDIGCFHGLAPSDRLDYLDQLDHLLAPSGTWLLYGFFRPPEFHKLRGFEGPGLTVREPEEMAKRLTLLWRKDGVDNKDRPSAWMCFQKP